MNIDTDTQYAFTRPIADHIIKNYDGVLMVDGDIGNKKAYDPRAYLKKAEEGMAARIGRACETFAVQAKVFFKRKSTSSICRVSLPKLGREINPHQKSGNFPPSRYFIWKALPPYHELHPKPCYYSQPLFVGLW